MRLPHTLPPMAPVLLAIAIVAGCTSVAGSSTPPATVGASGGSICPTLQPASDPSAWVRPPSATPPAVIPVLVNQQPVCGTNRLVFGLLDTQNRPIATPDRSARIAFYDLGRDAKTPQAMVDTKFVWAIEGSRGVYVASVDLVEAGIWGAEFSTTAAGKTDTVRLTFQVDEHGVTKAIGEKAPASKTPTLADVGGDVTRISSDTKPEPRFYQTSLDQALAKGQPIVLAFATPKFCTTGQCGPTLDRVKPLISAEPTVTFINVEPYQLAFTDGQLQPVLDAKGQLQPVQAVNDWGLLTEPYIFVIDRTGTITATFEGIVGDAELRAAVDAVK